MDLVAIVCPGKDVGAWEIGIGAENTWMLLQEMLSVAGLKAAP